MNEGLLAAVLAAAGEPPATVCDVRPLTGGDINAAWRLQTPSKIVFAKTHNAGSSYLPMYQTEALGLAALADSGAVRVPGVYGSGIAGGDAWLALEYFQLTSASAASAAQLGAALAQLHRTTRQRFGWDQANFIGLSPQPNPWTDDWATFYASARIGAQLELASQSGYTGQLLDLGERVIAEIPELFTNYHPAASLLHGDLWGGNWGAVTDEGVEHPVLFDPAVYFGDRETDIAMTELFGGFPQAFYAAYDEHWKLDAGYAGRRPLYQLYHVLNHLNLFGGGYEAQAVNLMRTVLSAR